MKGTRKSAARIGVVGLGLLGRGVTTCLLAHGFQVVAFNRTARRRHATRPHIAAALDEMVRRRLISRSRTADWRERLSITGSLDELRDCEFVIESVKEDLAVKREIFERLECVLTPDAIIASNTSSLPITLLQCGHRHPERFVGMHWGEPVQVMRYLEVIPGRETSASVVERTTELGRRCGKDPTVLNFDIRGFLSNRLMYAMIREACCLLESGVADAETIDRSFRNDIGWWATLAGPFRWMDLTGIPAYAAVMEGLLPELSNAAAVPRTMREMVARGGLGTSNGIGFYKYSKADAKRWERDWVEFTYDVRKLAAKYERRKRSLTVAAR